MSEYNTVTVGCDLGDKTTNICVMDKDGEVLKRGSCATSKKGFEKALKKWPGAVVAMEASTHSAWVSSHLKDLGYEVVVANARNVHLISKSKSKNDRNDAELLARIARVDRKLLSPISHRSKEVQIDLRTIRVRTAIINAQTRLINHVRSSLKTLGEKLPLCSTSCFAKNARTLIPAEYLPTFEPLLVLLDKMAEQIKELDTKIEKQLPKKYPETQVLRQVNGVGPITALAYVLTIEDPKRFEKSRKVGAYIGLRPAQKQSGKSNPELRITKHGDKYLRSLLVNCAQYILGAFGKDCDLRRWGLQLARRGGKNAKKRAIVAVARKLAVLLHRLWVTGEEYAPLGYRAVAV